ncbi:histidine kinase [Actinophytocola sediminis]
MRGVVATVIAVAMSVMSSIYVWGADGSVPGDDRVHSTWLSTLSLLAAFGAAVMLCWRHRWPLLVTGIALVPPLVLSDSLAALVALAALTAHRTDAVRWLGAAAVYVVTALAVWRDSGWTAEVTVAGRLIGMETVVGRVIGVLIVAAVLTAIPLMVGITRRNRLDLAREEGRARALRDEVARQDERSRIAREMHDALGHRLSLLSLHAGALEVSHQNGSPKTGEVARTVRTTARQSLEDLRQVIGVLRDGREPVVTDGGHRDHPQPTLTDLPALVAETRQAGLAVNLTVFLDQSRPAPAPLGMAVFRIVQESLTNVLRHAPGLPADLVVRGGPGFGITVEISNPLPATAAPSPGSGTGLTSIAERVAVLGGKVDSGPTDQGQFMLRAWLPWEPTA